MPTSTNAEIARGILSPFGERAIDPFSIKGRRKHDPFRVTWTLQSRLIEAYARRVSRSFSDGIDRMTFTIFHDERGSSMEDTTVSGNQMKVLLAAVADSPDGEIVEIGSYRGVSTREIALTTDKKVWAVDPFPTKSSMENDYVRFAERTGSLPNVEHLKTTSGDALTRLRDRPIAVAFVDAIHDFSNSWFDIWSWSRLVIENGFVVCHDVDDHKGVNLAVRTFLRRSPDFRVWGYVPNILALKRSASRTGAPG